MVRTWKVLTLMFPANRRSSYRQETQALKPSKPPNNRSERSMDQKCTSNRRAGQWQKILITWKLRSRRTPDLRCIHLFPFILFPSPALTSVSYIQWWGSWDRNAAAESSILIGQVWLGTLQLGGERLVKSALGEVNNPLGQWGIARAQSMLGGCEPHRSEV